MNTEIIIKQLSSLEKVFLDDDVSRFNETEGLSALKGERVSYQILYAGGSARKTKVKYSINADSRINLKICNVGSVPSQLACRRDEYDDYYLRRTAGLYPDVLYPMSGDEFNIVAENCHSMFITAELPEDIEAGVYPIEITFEYEEEKTVKTFAVKVLDAVLPKQSITYTQWFHADCISSYYKYKPLSEEHWAMIDKFIEKAAYTGINMILTPLFTLPLDTEIGRERPTVQLVDVRVDENGYKFGFDKLKRWIDMCKKHGIYNFEMSHLFSQWGTGCTPKIEAETKNGTEKIFGWHTKAVSDEYQEFLNCLLPELTEFLKAEGVYEATRFHISDEPNYEKHFEIYSAERKMVEGLIPADKIFDAMSHYQFYEQGMSHRPAVITDRIHEFFERGYTDIWAYYCCGPCNRGYGNRLLAMPNGRNRIIGMQLYKYGIEGFLHWGYNFYYSELSRREINPFYITDADEGFQSGDAYSVYPGEDGPIESLRSVVFYEGLQDNSACKLLEKYIGKEEVDKIINADGEITFNEYPRTDDGVLEMRNRIYRKIEEVLK